jgi:hypothetical protein
MDGKMDDNDLRKHLEQLHGEIEQTQNVDEKGQALLRDVKADIGGMLEGSVQPEPPTLKRIQEAIDTFEVSHPTLTRLLSQLLETLSNAGI